MVVAVDVSGGEEREVEVCRVEGESELSCVLICRLPELSGGGGCSVDALEGKQVESLAVEGVEPWLVEDTCSTLCEDADTTDGSVISSVELLALILSEVMTLLELEECFREDVG